jgi:hypothetical protein
MANASKKSTTLAWMLIVTMGRFATIVKSKTPVKTLPATMGSTVRMASVSQTLFQAVTTLYAAQTPIVKKASAFQTV